MPRRVSRGPDDLPLGVTEPEDLSVVERYVDRVRGDRLIQVLGRAAARVPALDGLGLRCPGRDGGALRLEEGVAADVVGVPVRVHHQADLPGVRAGPGGRLLGMTHEPGVDQGRLPPLEQQCVGVRERPLPPRRPGRQ